MSFRPKNNNNLQNVHNFTESKNISILKYDNMNLNLNIISSFVYPIHDYILMINLVILRDFNMSFYVFHKAKLFYFVEKFHKLNIDYKGFSWL